MAGVAYYNTGTATVAVNSKTVTGTGTNWLSVVGGLTAIKAGDKFGIHVGRPIIIASVDSNTQLTLEDNWPGPAQTNAAYRIELTSPDIIAVEAMRRMLGSLGSGVLYGLSQLPSTPSKALTIDENGSAALADLSPFGKSLIAVLNSSAAYGALGVIPNAQLPTRLQSFATRVSDWNSATEFGVYFGDGSTANTPASPFAFIGLVTPYTSAYFVQRLIAFGNVGTANNIEYVRECSNGTFSAWGRVRSTEAELDARYNVRSQTITNSQLPGTQTGKTFSSLVTTTGIVNNGSLIVNTNGTSITFQRNNADRVDIEAFLQTNGATKHSIDLNRYGGAVTINGQTAWHAGNDGAGSGLDADLLDGQQGAYYLDIGNTTGILNTARVPWISSFARTVLDDADGAAMLETMGISARVASALLQDQKASGVAGGASVVGWQTRTLNTEVFDPNNLVTLASNQFTVAFDCDCDFSTTAYHATGTNIKARIYNVTDNVAAAYSLAGYVTGNVLAISGEARLTAGKTYRLDMYVNVAQATNGLGGAVSDGSVEIYSSVKLRRV